MQLFINTRGTSLRRRKERFILRRKDVTHTIHVSTGDLRHQSGQGTQEGRRSLAGLGLGPQYSVFLGTVDKNRLDELVLFAESQLAETDKLYVIPVQRDDLSTARVVGLGFDEQLVTDEILTKVI